MHEVLVNRLGGLSLPRKSVVRITDRPDMTLDVYRGRKTTMQQQLQGVRGGYFHFYCILHRNSCKQTVLTLIRHRVLWRLNWFCTICITPKKGFLVNKGLKEVGEHDIQ